VDTLQRQLVELRRLAADRRATLAALAASSAALAGAQLTERPLMGVLLEEEMEEVPVAPAVLITAQRVEDAEHRAREAEVSLTPSLPSCVSPLCG
jgi:hypothetical protein